MIDNIVTGAYRGIGNYFGFGPEGYMPSVYKNLTNIYSFIKTGELKEPYVDFLIYFPKVSPNGFYEQSPGLLTSILNLSNSMFGNSNPVTDIINSVTGGYELIQGALSNVNVLGLNMGNELNNMTFLAGNLLTDYKNIKTSNVNQLLGPRGYDLRTPVTLLGWKHRDQGLVQGYIDQRIDILTKNIIKTGVNIAVNVYEHVAHDLWGREKTRYDEVTFENTPSWDVDVTKNNLWDILNAYNLYTPSDNRLNIYDSPNKKIKQILSSEFTISKSGKIQHRINPHVQVKRTQFDLINLNTDKNYDPIDKTINNVNRYPNKPESSTELKTNSFLNEFLQSKANYGERDPLWLYEEKDEQFGVSIPKTYDVENEVISEENETTILGNVVKTLQSSVSAVNNTIRNSINNVLNPTEFSVVKTHPFKLIIKDYQNENDFVKLKPYIGRLTENFSPSIQSFTTWQRTSPFYQYLNTSRTVSFTIDLIASSPEEFSEIHSSLIWIIKHSAFTPDYNDSHLKFVPLLRLTLGDYFKNQIVILNGAISLDYKFEEGMIELSEGKCLSKRISVPLSFSFLYEKNPTRKTKLWSFEDGNFVSQEWNQPTDSLSMNSSEVVENNIEKERINSTNMNIENIDNSQEQVNVNTEAYLNSPYESLSRRLG